MSKVSGMADRALAHQQLGELVQARALCQQILSVERRHFFALNLLGVIAGQQRHFRQAADWFSKALVVEPRNADAHANRGLALQELGAFESALVSYDRVIGLQPGHAAAHSRRGVVLQSLGRRAEALASFDAALASHPGFADAHSNRGILLQEMGRWQDALASFDRAIGLQPQFALAHNNRGNVLRELRRPDEALASYARALAADPACTEALVNRGLLLVETDRPDEALASLDLAIARQPRHAGAHLHRGNALMHLKQPDAALASLDRALALEPRNPEVHCARGSALRLLNEFAAALACHERALALRPDHAPALLNRGNVLVDLRRPAEAVTSFDCAVAAQPDLAVARFCRAIAWLQAGDYERGWAEYEWRWRSPHIAPGLAAPRQYEQPLWLGTEPLAGKTILLHAEQGLGDTIQFCRYAPLLADAGARVILEVPAPLAPLMTALHGISRVVGGDAAVPETVDFHCPLMSLPLALGTRPDSVPASIRYIHSEPDRLAGWRRRLADVGQPRIGLAWSGNPANPNDHNRSIALAQLIGELPEEFAYISLHRDDWKTERRPGNLHPRVLQVADAQSDLADAAALCDSLDLVISVDTSLAHLSAALGRKTWIILPFNADWRWMLDRDDSPWYPTVRLYRQPRPGDWSSVLQRIRADLTLAFGDRDGGG